MTKPHICYVYADQLLPLGHGLPLWYPEPSHLGEVGIGDVGFLETGHFHRLFNVMRSSEHPSNANGVPKDFAPLVVNESILVSTMNGYLPPGPIYNEKTMNCQVDAGVNTYAAVHQYLH